MIQLFSLEGIQKKPAVFDVTKLEWMNGQYLSALPANLLLDPVKQILQERGFPTTQDLTPYINAVKARSKRLTDIADQVMIRVSGRGFVMDPKGVALKEKLGQAFSENLRLAHEALVTLSDWTPANLEAGLKTLAEKEGKKLGDVMQPIRVALTGGTVSEPVNELLAVVGREESLARIAAAARE